MSIKYVGALYLFYLGVRAFRTHGQFELSAEGTPEINSVAILRQSVISCVLNPKTALFFLAFLPQFIDVNAGHLQLQILARGLMFTSLGFATYLPIAYFSGAVGRWLQQREAIAGKVRYVTAGVFFALGIWAAFPEPLA